MNIKCPNCEFEFNKSDYLTEREIQIIELINNGFSIKCISEKLYLASSTVKNHISNVSVEGNAKL